MEVTVDTITIGRRSVRPNARPATAYAGGRPVHDK